MSDSSQGPGWWRASDGKWYPPDTHPQYQPPEPPKAPPGPIAPFLPEQPSVFRRAWEGYRRWPRGGQIGSALGVVIVVLFVLARLGNDDQPVSSDAPAASSTTLVPATTTSTVVLPAGTDTTVASIVDGDSFTVADGTVIRMTGIDAPDTGACLATESTAHLTELIPVGTGIRLVYDSRRTDASDRDLAYVYRLSDGKFVNLAMATDGFAYELKVAPNVLHADELAAAVAAAQAAKVGVWASCSSSTPTTSGATSGGGLLRLDDDDPTVDLDHRRPAPTSSYSRRTRVNLLHRLDPQVGVGEHRHVGNADLGEVAASDVAAVHQGGGEDHRGPLLLHPLVGGADRPAQGHDVLDQHDRHAGLEPGPFQPPVGAPALGLFADKEPLAPGGGRHRERERRRPQDQPADRLELDARLGRHRPHRRPDELEVVLVVDRELAVDEVGAQHPRCQADGLGQMLQHRRVGHDPLQPVEGVGHGREPIRRPVRRRRAPRRR